MGMTFGVTRVTFLLVASVTRHRDLNTTNMYSVVADIGPALDAGKSLCARNVVRWYHSRIQLQRIKAHIMMTPCATCVTFLHVASVTEHHDLHIGVMRTVLMEIGHVQIAGRSLCPGNAISGTSFEFLYTAYGLLQILCDAATADMKERRSST